MASSAPPTLTAMTALSDPAPARRRVAAPHRRLRLAGAQAGFGLRSALLPRDAVRRRGRLHVCGAARLLTAAGVRVNVVPSPVPWPRTGGRLAVTGSPGRIGELAVLTAVPRTVPGWTALAEHALLGRRGAGHGTVADGVLLPVAVRFRRDGTEGWLDTEQVPRDLAAALAEPRLVVEVRLLPPLHPTAR